MDEVLLLSLQTTSTFESPYVASSPVYLPHHPPTRLSLLPLLPHPRQIPRRQSPFPSASSSLPPLSSSSLLQSSSSPPPASSCLELPLPPSFSFPVLLRSSLHPHPKDASSSPHSWVLLPPLPPRTPPRPPPLDSQHCRPLHCHHHLSPSWPLG